MKTPLRFMRQLLPALLLAFATSIALAHDGPEHEIEELTARLKAEGDSADLLVQRAIEFKVLGKLAEAAKDLDRALELDGSSALAHRELSLTYFALGKTNEALRAVNHGLGIPLPPADHAALLVARAEILRPRGEHEKALSDLNDAIQQHPGNIEWYLVRSELHARLKQEKERIRGLEQGIEATGSGVLDGELTDALIEAGQWARALERIEAEIKDSRWIGSWLIRRARVRQARGNSDGAKADLEAAITELEERMHPSSPDPLLLANRGLANELLGKKDEARKDYEAARQKGVTDEWLRERLAALGRPR